MSGGEEFLADFEPDEEEELPKVEEKEKPKTQQYTGVHISGFRDFLLKPELNRAVQDCGFEHPSEVQHQCIPQAILGQDLICQAKSGMGKTAVFVLSVLQQLEEPADEKFVSCLVIVHTRELAFQINNEFLRFSKYLSHAKSGVFYGGIPLVKDRERLNPKSEDFPNIVVGTPGRILGLSHDILKLGKVKHFILDECDKLLEQLDMRHDIQQIFLKTPKSKQVMMYSATMPKDVRETAKKFMSNPVEIYVDSDAKLTLHGLQQYYIKVSDSAKNRKLNELLDALEFNQVVIFVKSVQRARVLTELLRDCQFPATCIHSGMPQEERISTYANFKAFKSRIMVSTDLFGRGIDIERVNIVVNYDMPASADSYLHRVGRAGRFGTKGLAISFIGTGEDTDIMDAVGKRFEVEVKELPTHIEVSSYMQA